MSIVNTLTGYVYNSSSGIFDSGKGYESFSQTETSVFDAHSIPAGGFSFNTLKLLLKRPSDPGLYTEWADVTLRVWRVSVSAASSISLSDIDGSSLYAGNMLTQMPMSRNSNFANITFLGESSKPVSQLSSGSWPTEETFTFPSMITVDSLSSETTNSGMQAVNAYFIVELRSYSQNITYGIMTENTHGSITVYSGVNTRRGNYANVDTYFELSSVVSNQAPTDIQLVGLASIQETTIGGSLVGTLSASDDKPQPVTFSIVGGLHQQFFEISGTELRLVAGALIAYETTPQVELVIRATDADGATYDEGFNFPVLDVQEGGGSGSGGGSGGSGSSSTPISDAVVVDGKAVGTVSVDPRATPVRVTIAGVEQALPEGSVVRNPSTGQKFFKVAGGEMAFAAISITPPAEWSWSAAGAQYWAVLQGY